MIEDWPELPPGCTILMMRAGRRRAPLSVFARNTGVSGTD